MEKAKLRLLAAAGGALFGFAGAMSMAYALVVVLTPILGLAWATVSVGAIFIALACLCLFYFLMPYKAAEEEAHQAEALAAETLADLPFDTVEHIVKKHPLSAVAMALAAGYVVAKDPHNATRGVQRVLSGLL
jgi:hypothetical protein